MAEENEVPVWRLKYLPTTLDEVCGREKSKERLKEIIKEQNFPHLLFVGREGIGKTTIAKLFIKEFLGPHYDANYKLVYADVPLTDEERKQARSDAYVSTSRIGSLAGKKMTTPAFIQVKVKPFVQLKVLGGAPFKVLIVKNFEALENNQQGFRRLMETYGSNCRMILITTKISGIIDPIISRCQLFLLPQADFNSFKELMNRIASEESLTLKDGFLELLYQVSEGKIAKAIDLMQLCSIGGDSLTEDMLYEKEKGFRNELIPNLLIACFKGDFDSAREISRDIQQSLKVNAHELFSKLLEELKILPISKFSHAKLINFIADADFRAIDGLDDDIQISALLSKICLFSEYM